MERDFVDRLRRLREAHAVLAVELSAAKRDLHRARGEVAGLRAELERERQRKVMARPIRAPIGSRG